MSQKDLEEYCKQFDKASSELSEKMRVANGGNMVAIAVVAVKLTPDNTYERSSSYTNFSMTPQLMSPVFDTLMKSMVDANIRYFLESNAQLGPNIISGGNLERH